MNIQRVTARLNSPSAVTILRFPIFRSGQLRIIPGRDYLSDLMDYSVGGWLSEPETPSCFIYHITCFCNMLRLVAVLIQQYQPAARDGESKKKACILIK